ncbi:MAG: Uma2 family endonuclease [Oscillospiraceae bacterium]|nr:Uma2 family endonuclease [Oscillospiraceae bacterium]
MAINDNLAYQEEPLYEILDGKVLAMSPAAPRHNRIAGNIFLIFGNYLKKKKCVPLGDGTAVYLDEQNRFIPDFMVVCDRSKIQSKWVYGAPDLLVEILSPSTARNDRMRKKDVYAASGVPEYWIVSPEEQSIEVYLLRDGAYTLDNLYAYCSDEDQADMTEAEKAGLTAEFKCHLFDDLTIRLEDIFGDLF